MLFRSIDSCALMLEQCNSKISAHTALELICTDFTCFELPQKADVIYMPFRTIGHILTRDDLAAFFANVSENLKPRGLFIFDHYMFDKEWAARHNNIDIPMYRDADTEIVDRYEYDFTGCIMHCTVKINNETAVCFDFRWLEVNEINELYTEYGFSCVDMFGDFDKTRWTPESPNQIWVLRREVE